MEPHFPYVPPKDDFDRVLSRRVNPQPERDALGDMWMVHPQRWEHPDPVAIDLIHDLYDAEVMSIDAQLQVLFSELGKRGFLRNTIAVITADHGEELAEHGAVGHGRTLYNEVIRIPLLLLVPDQPQRVDVSELVSEVDIAPTVLDLGGMRSPAPFEGRSLRVAMGRARKWDLVIDFLSRLLRRDKDPAPTAYSELLTLPWDGSVPQHVRSVVLGSHKLIVDALGKYHTYDLVADPQETSPQDQEASDRFALEHALQLCSRCVARNVSPPRTAVPDEPTRERMRALGYGN